MGVVGLRNPLFLILGILTPVQGREVHNTKPLKTLTSLNKEVWPFFLGDNSIWSFCLLLPLAITQHFEVLKAILALRS